MRSVSVIAAFSFVTGLTIAPAQAQLDGDRLVRGILGSGVKAIVEGSRQTNQPRQSTSNRSPAVVKSETVRMTQKGLNAMGFNAGPEDGLMGGTARQAIRDYQTSIGAPSTGTLTDAQSVTVHSAATGAYVGPANASTAIRLEVLTRDQVQQLQEKLNTAGYDAGTVDGVPGARTREAVAAWMNDTSSKAATASDVFEQIVSGNTNQTADATSKDGETGDHITAAEQRAAEIGSASFTIYSGVRDRYDATLLARLLYLKADPGILNRMPQAFLGFLPADRIFDYADRDSYVFKDVPRKPDALRNATNSIAIAGPWKGDNEFEVRDTIERFIANERAYFEALLPDEVIVDHYQSAAVDRYTGSGLNLEISGWDNGGVESDNFTRTVLDVPVTFPRRWEMSQEEARSLLENQLKESRAIYIRTRYRIGNPEVSLKGVFAATEALSIDIIGRVGKQEKLGSLPIVPVLDPAQLASRISGESEAWPLDPETVRMLAASEVPTLIEDDAFMRDTYKARAVMQDALRRGHYDGKFADPDAMSSAMLANGDSPSAAQLNRYRDYVRASIANVPAEVEFPYLRCIDVKSTSGTRNGCFRRNEAEGDVVYLELKSLLGELEKAGGSGVYKADELYDQTKPDDLRAANHLLYEAGRNMPVFLSFIDHPALYHQTFDSIRTQVQGVTLRARIAAVKVVREPVLHVHVALEPAALEVSYPGSEESIDLSVTPAAPSTGFDIVGVSFGTRMSDVAAILVEAGFEPAVTNWEVQNPIFAQAISMKKFVVSDGVKITEVMAFVSDDAGPDGLVRGIGRDIDFEGSEETLKPALYQQLRESLVAKYGDPALVDDDEIIWAIDQAMQARLRSGSRTLFKSCTDGSNGTREAMTAADDIAAYQIVMRIAKDAFIETSCGQVLYARGGTGGVRIVLSDSEFIVEEAASRRALTEQDAAEKESALPAFEN